MRVSARLQANAAPAAPAPMINTSTVSSGISAPFRPAFYRGRRSSVERPPGAPIDYCVVVCRKITQRIAVSASPTSPPSNDDRFLDADPGAGGGGDGAGAGQPCGGRRALRRTAGRVAAPTRHPAVAAERRRRHHSLEAAVAVSLGASPVGCRDSNLLRPAGERNTGYLFQWRRDRLRRTTGTIHSHLRAAGHQCGRRRYPGGGVGQHILRCLPEERDGRVRAGRGQYPVGRIRGPVRNQQRW